MEYSDALCQLVIENMAVLREAPSVVEHVEKRLFTAINKRIEERVASWGDWKGCYDLITGDEDETSFAPGDWPENEDKDGEYLACFTLTYIEAGEDYEWLANAIGLDNTALSLQFEIDRAATGLQPKEHKKCLHDFYNETPALAETGFRITKGGEIYREFALDAAKVAEEYPAFDEALEELEKALDSLESMRKTFDRFVTRVSA